MKYIEEPKGSFDDFFKYLLQKDKKKITEENIIDSLETYCNEKEDYNLIAEYCEKFSNDKTEFYNAYKKWRSKNLNKIEIEEIEEIEVENDQDVLDFIKSENFKLFCDSLTDNSVKKYLKEVHNELLLSDSKDHDLVTVLCDLLSKNEKIKEIDTKNDINDLDQKPDLEKTIEFLFNKDIRDKLQNIYDTQLEQFNNQYILFFDKENKKLEQHLNKIILNNVLKQYREANPRVHIITKEKLVNYVLDNGNKCENTSEIIEIIYNTKDNDINEVFLKKWSKQASQPPTSILHPNAFNPFGDNQRSIFHPLDSNNLQNEDQKNALQKKANEVYAGYNDAKEPKILANNDYLGLKQQNNNLKQLSNRNVSYIDNQLNEKRRNPYNNFSALAIQKQIKQNDPMLDNFLNSFNENDIKDINNKLIKGDNKRPFTLDNLRKITEFLFNKEKLTLKPKLGTYSELSSLKKNEEIFSFMCTGVGTNDIFLTNENYNKIYDYIKEKFDKIALLEKAKMPPQQYENISYIKPNLPSSDVNDDNKTTEMVVEKNTLEQICTSQEKKSTTTVEIDNYKENKKEQGGGR